MMATITKAEAVVIIRRAYGPDFAEAVADKLPESFDPENDADAAMLTSLGLTPDRLASALGGEL
jgi:hypothetical protein